MTVIVIELTCQNENGGCDHECTDTEIGVNCSCYDGYQLINNQNCSGSKSCVLHIIVRLLMMFHVLDIDECTTGTHNCTQNQRCINSPGFYVCECAIGYELINGTCEGNC